MRVAARRKCVGRRALVAQVDERVVHERMVDEMDRHGPSLYNFCLMRASTVAAVIRGRTGLGIVAAGFIAGQPTIRTVSLVVIGGTVVTENAGHEVLSPGRRRDRRRRRSSTSARRTAIAAQLRRRRAPSTRDDQVVLPGLINTHTHAPMVMYRGLADDLALMDWLQKYIFPAEAKTVSPEFVRVGHAAGGARDDRVGHDDLRRHVLLRGGDREGDAGGGLRGVLGQTIIQFPVADAKTPAEGLARAEAFIKAFKDDSLIVPAVAPHAMYTLDQATLKATRGAGAAVRRAGADSPRRDRRRSEESREQHQATPAGYLESIGFLGPRTLAAHGVWVTDEDIAILARRGVGVSHNPESNMKLASGAAPVTKYLAAGVALGLGTDGAASNNDLDMFEAMRQAAFLAKLTTRDPTAVPARAALDDGDDRRRAARSGWTRSIGSLETGKRADLIAVVDGAARQTPLYDPVSHLVYVTRGRRRADDHRQRQGADAGRRVLTLDRAAVIADAESRWRSGGPRRRSVALRRRRGRRCDGRLRYCSA